MKIWLTQHARTLVATLAGVARSPFTTLLNICVIGIALALPIGGYVILGSVQHVARAHGSTPQLSLFLALDAGADDVGALRERLKQHANVLRFTFVPRDQALRELRASAGLAEIVDSLQHNPLPDAFVVDARDGAAGTLEQMREEFRKWPRVMHVQLDSAWARRLEVFLGLGEVLVLLLASVLGFGMAAVTFNTIRQQILTQRVEIEVSRLIGATDSFVCRPFLYYGAVLGGLGGVAAWALVAAGTHVLNRGLAELGALYGADLRLLPLTLAESGGILLASAALGWLGAWLSVHRHLRAADPV